MKFFIDTASIGEIKQALALGVLDGVTTNPSLLAKEEGDPFDRLREICALVDGPISAEVTSTDTDGMVREGEALARIHHNIVVKTPMTKAGLAATKILRQKGIRINMTLVFSAAQGLLAAKVGATFISPFLGRLDDIGHVGMDLVRDLVTICENYGFASEVLAASIRSPLHVIDAALAGAHIATMPFAVIDRLVKHPLTDIGLERFLEDWKNAQRTSR
ncbi:MAG: fructose-6-phosphate aldolase [Candidatus Latescibacteria bacterium]|nr:fructose-6-phosphate aldolase [Candidatus Latescibacterota bacterium]